MSGSQEVVREGDRESLVNYRTIAPNAREAQPLSRSLYAAAYRLGAAGPDARGKVLHQSWDLGDLGMGAFEFTH